LTSPPNLLTAFFIGGRPALGRLFCLKPNFQGMSDEAHLSTEQSRSRPPSRLSSADVDPGRSRRDSCPSGSRSQEAVGLIPLRRRADFLAANKGKRMPMPGFVLLVRPRGDEDETIRLGITVTKKIGNAVIRNRMKRRFRALGREILPTLGVAGADHVLIGRESGVERGYKLLQEELVKALAKAVK
jgi:ribonuclease P protein component